MTRWAPWVWCVLAACSSGTLPGPDGGADAGDDGGEREIIRAHNAVRARAMPAPSPALPALTWSQAAADVAAAWVERCRFEHNTGIGGMYGENIFGSTGSETATEVVESWAAEAPGYDHAANTCASVCGHYTQIVWRGTLSVGCASKVCQDNSPLGSGPWLFWVCDYAPAGNVNGARPY